MVLSIDDEIEKAFSILYMYIVDGDVDSNTITRHDALSALEYIKNLFQDIEREYKR